MKVSQKEYFEHILTERDRRYNAQFNAAKEAVIKAEMAAKETMASHNDLIRQSRDRDATYATQVEINHIMDSINRIQNIQSKIVGALILVSFLAPTISALIVYVSTH